MTDPARTRPEQVRDLIMMGVMVFWTVYGAAAVVQLLTTGAKVLESLPPYYFWGIPLAPYTALYAPWRSLPGSSSSGPPAAPEPPAPPVEPAAPEPAP